MKKAVERGESTKFLIEATLMKIRSDKLFKKACPCGGYVQEPLDNLLKACDLKYCTKCHKFTNDISVSFHCGKFFLQDWSGQVFAFAYKEVCESVLTDRCVQNNTFQRGLWLIDVGEYRDQPAYYVHAFTPLKFQKECQNLILELQQLAPSKLSEIQSEMDIQLDLKQLMDNITDCLLMKKVHNLVPREPPAAPSVWVTKYLDSSQKFGFAFGLVDGTVGVHFRDGTKMVSRDKIEYVESFQKDNEKKVWKRQVVGKNAEASVEKKKNLLGYFKTALYKEEGPERPFSINIAEMDKPPVFLHKWFKTKSSLIFVLSNNTVQVRLPDRSSVLFSGEGMIVSFIEPTLESVTTYLPSAVLDPMLKVQVAQAKDLLHYWLSERNAKSGCDTEET